MNNSWKKIWLSREILDQEHTSDNKLENLLYLDGMNTGFGSVSIENWQQYVIGIMQRTQVDSNSTVFEVGCGSGAFLYPMYKNNITVSGSDYSERLIRYANQAMSDGDFYFSDAADDIPATFSHLFSSGVFLYFPSLSYAEKVIQKMITSSSDVIAILDIPDKQKQSHAERTRRELYIGDDYDKHYAGLNHLYFEKEWFVEKLTTLGCNKINIEDQDIKDYDNSSYRFNVFARK